MTIEQTMAPNDVHYEYIGGRRYITQTDVAYMLPKDDDENYRLYIQHKGISLALQRKFHAPVEEMLQQGIHVLDSGCGPAIWTLEMSQTYPSSMFYGMDISPVNLKQDKPRNVEFMVGNIAKRIPYPDNMFDYIHQRLLLGGLTHDDWNSTLQELFRVLKPGGYLELAEVDISHLHQAGPAMNTMQTAFMSIMNSRKLRHGITLELKDRLDRIGFENITTKKFDIPLNHGGEAGTLMWETQQCLYSSVKPLMIQVSPTLGQEGIFEMYVDACAKEVKQSKTCLGWFVVYAKKPTAEINEEIIVI